MVDKDISHHQIISEFDVTLVTLGSSVSYSGAATFVCADCGRCLFVVEMNCGRHRRTSMCML